MFHVKKGIITFKVNDLKIELKRKLMEEFGPKRCYMMSVTIETPPIVHTEPYVPPFDLQPTMLPPIPT